MKIMIFAALDGEIKHITRQLGARKTDEMDGRKHFQAAFGGKKITVALTGMGVKNAGVRAGRMLRAQRPDLVLNVGFAGALYPDARHGEIVCPEKAL
nr:hypothetical protein [Nitrospiraceae bacterium]